MIHDLDSFEKNDDHANLHISEMTDQERFNAFNGNSLGSLRKRMQLRGTYRDGSIPEPEMVSSVKNFFKTLEKEKDIELIAAEVGFDVQEKAL